MLTYSCDYSACKKEGARQIPVTGVCWVAWWIHSIFPGIQNHLQIHTDMLIKILEYGSTQLLLHLDV